MKKPVRYFHLGHLYQVTFMKKAAHHVVKESVDYAKVEHGIHTAGFVNAVLRRFLEIWKKKEFTYQVLKLSMSCYLNTR